MIAKQSGKNKHFLKVPLNPIDKVNTACFETTDLSVLKVPGQFLIRGGLPRNPEALTARLCKQFIRDNRGLLLDYGVNIDSDFDGNLVNLIFKTGSTIGALPLLSPTTGKPDFGLIIKPRFDWSGLGPMLSIMGWKVVPTPLRLPLLPGTERKVPSWVISSIVLIRIKHLLEQLNRNFIFTDVDLLAPKGTVDWSTYAISKISNAKYLEIPCRYPDLKENEELKSGIHFTLRKLLSSLESQRTSGVFVVQLLEICMSLIAKVSTSIPKYPSSLAMQYWYNLPVSNDVFRNGLQAIEWTIDDRGLAGIGDLQGLPWIMPMESFFEAWLETIGIQLVRRIGGQLSCGRKKETITPISWEPPYLGSQKYLLPDIIVEKDDEVIILDAKYKEHWEEINFHQWSNVEEQIKHKHREDLMQVLAYSTLTDKKKITTCLVYPCQDRTWQSITTRGRSFHRASLYAGSRKINLVLTAIPMNADISLIIDKLSVAIQN